ncbi:hypothetical protein JVX98_19360 [Ensifer sp. PDNC004]|uniref:hypothetical protein n=1 Tax=Ensifer sp. PDNC004 TaxID=2811423 RepID=UPI0019662F51|nr:hypothetical protein [Ensifer sp. PDNC004]QRY66555.1 hypothetical protein JVX98_19360 [Ensifer sp. PDNC004]
MINPLSLPDLPWRECEFNPNDPVSTERMQGRRTEMVTFGTPWWTATFSTNFLEPQQYGAADAFTMKAGARGAFLGYDVFRPRPIAYDNGRPLALVKAAGGPFTGDASLSQIIDSRTVMVSGLPAGFTLIEGDYVAFSMTALKRSLHRVMQVAVANSAGVATLSILFPLDLQHFTLASAVHFEKPSTVMMIDPGSLSAPKGWNNRSVTFSATEMFFS